MGKADRGAAPRSHTIRTGRACAALLDRIVDRLLRRADAAQSVGRHLGRRKRACWSSSPGIAARSAPIEKAILKSDLGLNPTNDGQVIRIAIPPLTEERRKQLVKVVHNHVEEGKVAVRNIRRDATASTKDLMNERMISEDDERRALHQVDELTKRFIDEAEHVGKAKEQEVLEV